MLFLSAGLLEGFHYWDEKIDPEVKKFAGVFIFFYFVLYEVYYWQTRHRYEDTMFKIKQTEIKPLPRQFNVKLIT